MIDLKFCTHSSNKLLHKSVPTIFLIELFSFCGNTLANFEITFWKITDKNRLSKKYLKRRKTSTVFLGLGYMHFSEKNYRKPQMCWCRSSYSRKPGSFFVQFLPLFSQYLESTKKVQNIYWKYWNILQKYWKYWKHGSNNAWKQRITLSFCLKGTLRPNNSVQVYDSVEWQKHLILMRRGRKAKLPKLLKVS